MTKTERLSDAQQSALKYPEVSSISGDMKCIPGYNGTEATLMSLVRKGYLADPTTHGQYWLTEKGEQTRHRLLYEICPRCKAETHRHEAACVACGALKEWA